MTAPASLSQTIQFHRQNSRVLEVTAYTFTDAGDAVLIHVTEEGHSQGTGSYHYVPYCQAHEIAWDSKVFSACPLCKAEDGCNK